MLIFSALPFAAVQALADSDLGKQLQVRMHACAGFRLPQPCIAQGTDPRSAGLQRDLEAKKKGFKAQEQRQQRELAAARQRRHACWRTLCMLCLHAPPCMPPSADREPPVSLQPVVRQRAAQVAGPCGARVPAIPAGRRPRRLWYINCIVYAFIKE